MHIPATEDRTVAAILQQGTLPPRLLRPEEERSTSCPRRFIRPGLQARNVHAVVITPQGNGDAGDPHARTNRFVFLISGGDAGGGIEILCSTLKVLQREVKGGESRPIWNGWMGSYATVVNSR